MELSFGGTQIAGILIMMLISGLSSLAGLGGGGPNVVILITCFGVLPKDATIMVFACVFGSAFGNMLNQTRRAIDGEPVVNYTYISITIPIMFVGTLIGVMFNQLFPSLITVSIIVGTALISLPKIFNRFRQAY
jgi:uncharacterized membrane protein YfcA